MCVCVCVCVCVFSKKQQYFIIKLIGNNFLSIDHPLQKLSALIVDTF